MKLAIVGTGIAGLGCAYFLHQRFETHIFEQNDYAGGHIKTVTVPENSRNVPIDTGFMVYNEVTYPHLTRLLKKLGVATRPTDMSFSVQHLPGGIEWCGSSLNHLFAQRRNLLRPRYWRFLLSVDRFNRQSLHHLTYRDLEATTLKEYIRELAYDQDLMDFYLVPMSSAIWSTPPDSIMEFPAATLIRFFHNHGLLGMDRHHQWYTISGGARNYVEHLVASFKHRIRLNTRVEAVERSGDGVTLTLADGSREDFDMVILGTHADQSLSLLANPTDMERQLLCAFKYQPNTATLHSDSLVMPKRRLCWASWNYRVDPPGGQITSTTHYWMNNLQRVSRHADYFVSINAQHIIDPSKVFRTLQYDHPVFTLEAMRAQKRLCELNTVSPNQRVYFCGSYFGYGFHEDAFASALKLVRQIAGDLAWS